jgi:hypothetical protein
MGLISGILWSSFESLISQASRFNLHNIQYGRKTKAARFSEYNYFILFYFILLGSVETLTILETKKVR